MRFLIKKNSKAKIFYDSLIVNAASLIEKAFFFAANIIIARYLSLEQFGEYSTALSFATFFSLLTDIGINVTLVRALNLNDEYANEHFTNAFFLKIALAVVMYGIMSASLLFTGYNSNVINLTLILGLVRIGNEFMKTYYAVDEAKQNFFFPSLTNSVYVVFFLSGIIAVTMYGGDYYHICVVRLVIVFTFIAFLSVYVLKKIKFRFIKHLCIHFAKSAFPFAVYSVLWNITFRINAIIISLIAGTTQVGLFNNSMLFIDTLSIVPANMRRIFMPSLYAALKNDDKNKFQFTFDTMSKYFGILSAFMMILLFIYAEEVILLIFGDKYSQAAGLLKILALALPFVFNMATIIIVGLDKQFVLTKILVISTLVNLASNIILIKLFGINGAAFSVLATYAVIFILGYGYLKVYEKLKIDRIARYYFIISIISVFIIAWYKFTGLKALPIYLSFLFVAISYAVLSVVFLLNKDDVRIVREMIGID